ncbi:hypothetical protein ACP6JB_005798 [Aspergillus fumigatus]
MSSNTVGEGVTDVKGIYWAEKEMAQKAVLMDAVFINAVDGLVTSKVKTREDAQTYWEHTARPSPRDYGIGDR